MSKQVVLCPECKTGRVSANEYQVRCDRCAWVVLDPDPLWSEYAERLDWDFPDEGPLLTPFSGLPDNFGALLTTTRSALPPNHPARGDGTLYGDGMTAVAFRKERESLGLSAEWLAEHMGVALKTVQRWENGHRPIPSGVANELSTIWYAMHSHVHGCAAHILETTDPVMMIPRTGTYLGLPASWYRALVDRVRSALRGEEGTDYGDEGREAADFPVVYMDEVGEQQ